jgi:hypothetical protein
MAFASGCSTLACGDPAFGPYDDVLATRIEDTSSVRLPAIRLHRLFSSRQTHEEVVQPIRDKMERGIDHLDLQKPLPGRAVCPAQAHDDAISAAAQVRVEHAALGLDDDRLLARHFIPLRTPQ